MLGVCLRPSARVADREDRQPVTFAARAFGTVAGVIADDALQERAAQQFAGHGQPCEEPLALQGLREHG
jgi:hypothetical protein